MPYMVSQLSECSLKLIYSNASSHWLYSDKMPAMNTFHQNWYLKHLFAGYSLLIRFQPTVHRYISNYLWCRRDFPIKMINILQQEKNYIVFFFYITWYDLCSGLHHAHSWCYCWLWRFFRQPATPHSKIGFFLTHSRLACYFLEFRSCSS